MTKVKAVSKNGETKTFSSVAEAANSVGGHETLIYRSINKGVRHKGYRWTYETNEKPVYEKPNGCYSEDQLRQLFDIKAIVFGELEKLQQGEFWKDQDFVRRFSGKGAYRSILESPEALQYKGKAQGQIFWSHPRSIEKLKYDGVLI